MVSLFFLFYFLFLFSLLKMIAMEVFKEIWTGNDDLLK